MITINFEEAKHFGALLSVITDPFNHWKLDESPSATTAVDSGSDGYDLTSIEGNADFTTSGLISNGMEFTGADGDRCYEISNFSPAAGDWAIGCFAKFDDFGTTDGRQMSQTSGVFDTNHDWMLSTNSPGTKARVRMRIDGTVEELSTGVGVLSTGTWHHIVATYDAGDGDLILYVDKVDEVSDLTLSGNFSNNSTYDVGIGNTPGTIANRCMDGILDDVRTFEHSLTQADVNAWYAVGFPSFIQRVTMF
jgi:hypothetical protein